ncbi:MAG: sugar phosphate isomerase/epimerase [Synergistales bacterium]|nr:sugar phosphate isomerase/epimerase [Synergistales bacterium]
MHLSYAVATKDTSSRDILAYRASLSESAARLRDLGYEALELMIRDPQELDAEEIRATLERYGLRVAAIGTGSVFSEDRLSFMDPDEQVRKAAIERACSIVRFAQSTASPVVVGKLRGQFVPGIDRETSRKWARDGFLKMLDEASSRGVKVLLEPQSRVATNFLRSTQEGLAWIRELSHPALGIMLDTFHMNIEDASPVASIIEACPYLGHVHLADNNRLAPGKGHINFLEILRTLKAVGYRGYLSIEISQVPDQDTAAREAFAYLHQLLLSV